MNPAAPFLFRYTPSGLPIRESISTVVGVRRGGWHCRHHWWQDWLYWWQGWRWRCCGWASAVVHSATPRFLVCCPSIFVTHCAIEWVHRTYWHRTSRRRCWVDVWWCGWRRRWWCGRWRGWRCRERSGWNCHWRLWQSRVWTGCDASPAHGAAAEILLCLGPSRFPH